MNNITLDKFELDFAPKDNGMAFNKWCEKYGFYPLNSARRAWCPDFETYFRSNAGVIIYKSSGNIGLFYEEDSVIYDENDDVIHHLNNNEEKSQ